MTFQEKDAIMALKKSKSTGTYFCRVHLHIYIQGRFAAGRFGGPPLRSKAACDVKCCSSIRISTSRLLNVLSYSYVNSMLAHLAILDMSTCYHSSASSMRQNVVQKVHKRCRVDRHIPGTGSRKD